MSTYSPSQITFVRRDIWSLETSNIWDPVTLAYARAVREMQARPATDPTSWAWQAAMHGTYDSPPRGALWNQCQHASWFFLPWHRMYLYWFEQIVRAAVVQQGGPPDWALPYWNYSKGFPSNTLPPAFRQPTMPDGSPNALFVAQRNPLPPPGINGGAQLPPRATSHAIADNVINFSPPPSPGFGGGRSSAMQFENATGALENQPHNIIHGLVGGASRPLCGGGLMSDPMCAARDPIFWLHHANIDHLWSHWIAMGGGRADPTDNAWLTQQFTFYGPDGNTVTMACQEVRDTVGQLDYRYDDEAPLVARRPTVPAQQLTAARGSAADHELLGASDGGTQLGGRATTLTVTLPRESRAALARAADDDHDPSRLRLDIEGVEVDEDPGVVYEV
ncbi:MAG: tyrosinase family protein, partial [Actinomycetota bacterium]|nr:tyrosinase family protein [Actinomycetota bacterium]